MPSGVAVVWLKRDLRLLDHAPLHSAAQSGLPVLALAVLEPAWRASTEWDAQHSSFWLASLAELRERLAERGIPLWLVEGEVLSVLAELHHRFRIQALYSHEETGPGWTYARDLAVLEWCRVQRVPWQEAPQTGVIRKLKSRNAWASRWEARMRAPQYPAPACVAAAIPPALQPPPLPSLARWVDGARRLPSSGEAAAGRVLQSFLQFRGAGYRRGLSSPNTAGQSCSRLSPHLAFGTVSLKQVLQATEARMTELRQSDAPGAAGFARSVSAFAGRLRWHCHFMQKLEDEPDIEFVNFSRAANGLRPGDGPVWDDAAEQRYQAWAAGQTGFPMVDACMRALNTTGWLNFRMRAMLMSFSSYHLWLHWRKPAQHLARQFLDFEAGIHWSQAQMQSGTTGINTLRMYSPKKQAEDHDADGAFIARWVPELAALPAPYRAAPLLAPPIVLSESGIVLGQHYPLPLVDEVTALRDAKTQLYGLRRSKQSQAEAQAIQHKHGSRKSGLPSTGMRRKLRKGAAPAPTTGDLFAAEDGDG